MKNMIERYPMTNGYCTGVYGRCCNIGLKELLAAELIFELVSLSERGPRNVDVEVAWICFPFH